MKRGLDQLTAWLLAVALAGTTYGVVYGIVKVSAKLAGGRSNDHNSAESHHGSHASEDTDKHDTPAGHGSEHSDGHGDDHNANHGDDHGAKHDDAHDKPEAAPHGSDQHGDEHDDIKKGKGHDDAALDHSGKATKSAALTPEPWGYRGSIGPNHWGKLSSSYVLCDSGKKQSPVDIAETTAGGKLLPIRWHYKPSAGELKQLGDRFTLNLADRGLSIDVEGERYDFVRLDFHAPSQHKFSGLPFDLELSLVHKDGRGQLVIVNVLVEEGAANAPLEELVKRLPVPEKGLELETFDLAQLLPKKRTYYRYDGSLTMPPCSEGVIQIVMTRSIEASARQIDALAGAIGFNARPVQALKGRRVLKSTR